jgi:cell division protein FtsI (penicillin-binding protein 3)
MAIFPADNPQYQLLVMIDEPQALKETYGFITAGWNAAPTGGNVIARIAPLLGVEPRNDIPSSDSMILASVKQAQQ